MSGVDIFNVALNAGTSVKYIEETYAKSLKTRMVSDDITQDLGVHRVKNQ